MFQTHLATKVSVCFAIFLPLSHSSHTPRQRLGRAAAAAASKLMDVNGDELFSVEFYNLKFIQMRQ